jgi:hypothetical protein
MVALIVAVLQGVIVALAAGVTWGWAGGAPAQATAAGGACAVAGTLAYAAGQFLIPGRSASQLLWGHVAGEIAKVAVALGLLLWGLSADPAYAPGPFLAGFILALLAYPLAMLLFKSK